MKLNLFNYIVIIICWVTALFVLTSAPAQESGYYDLSGHWKFKIDPGDTGIEEKWFTQIHSDSLWDTMKVPGFWESRDAYSGYDGAAWYRVWVELPATFADKPVYLGLGGMDDEFDLWIDGAHFGHFGDRQSGYTFYQRKSVHNVSDWLGPGRHLLAFRVIDWQGGGGIHRGPVALAVDSTYFMTPVERVKKVAKMYPDALWPYWIQGYGRSWTVIGLEEAVSEGMVSRDGAVGSKEWPHTISLWLTTNNGTVYAPERYHPTEINWKLQEGFLPLPVLSYGDEKIRIEQSYLVVPEESGRFEDGLIRIRYTILSQLDESEKGTLYLAIRPYQMTGAVGEITRIRWNDTLQAVLVDDGYMVFCGPGKPQKIIRQPVSVLNFEDSPGDISLYSVLGKKSGDEQLSVDPELEINAAAADWPIRIIPGKNTFEFTIPLQAIDISEITSPPSAKVSGKTIAEIWKNRLKNVKLQIPDKRMSDAYYASLAYILINADQNMPHPGTWAYDLFWYRDTAYILAALLRNGFFKFARQTVNHLMQAQRADGEFPPIFDLNYKQVGHREWDSQGQALFSLSEYVRFTNDTALARRYWPNVLRGVGFLDSLQTVSPIDILPPSWSAEDLGSSRWHHYWDDFWAIRGLQDAAWLARQIGEEPEAIRLPHKAETLRRNTLASINRLMDTTDIHWIPNGPEDLYGSSMARGTGPGVWPGGPLNPRDSLTRSSFDYYWNKWIKPYQGAYLHQGKFWPYAFELAACYVLLDKPQRAHRIVGWHLDHQTMPGVYAWGEQLDTTTAQFYAGDIPHGWVAADFINLVRTMLVYEKDDSLALGAGIPWKWLTDGQEVGISAAPTYFGSIGYSLHYTDTTHQLQWQMDTQQTAANGIKLKIPDRVDVLSVSVDGRTWENYTRSAIRIPSHTKSVVAWIKLKNNERIDY